MARERAPKRIGDSLGSVLKSIDRHGYGLARAKVTQAWEEVAGPQIAKHATGAFLRDGDLVIYVDSPVWANELQAMAEDFRTAVNKEIGRETVSAMRFVVSRRVGQDAAARKQAERDEALYRPDPVAYVELEPEEKEALAAEAERIEDPTLREAFLRARIAAFLWKKGSDTLKASQGPREGSTETKNT